ncbi:30S ribosomal protein S2 [Candidatus Woesebacteria bacterium RIFCSPHIGHO2_01_FULL_44_10]|uniref:Small ribosomal subunit protein uS2 n=1 Tax=Candidatus Woesebacteria bacterium RIFCSPLOWO2_01_FULL_44_14 TaxID=1802525 RepID=A0A1F8C584_9BACT|nr:MAG: 30S ribosomal protein S2 [Candidatus Woesebacteria bacterium RIFCSPHIGHO2_01_FULL_44_10]OGM55635.1 MAG: 30S ribosomal protein S2 [Candidatus Woesebacteria bacterium RIFCSPHIGHO2_12_FULL_44_11]OGM70908.1 MAG: 30S ribosomal protein S2 [Candidatus Woesebacteria bacterium RIFCSPLOWO2_01_FULL_44_14]
MASAKKIDVTLEELMEAGAHFGHQSKRWNPLMKPYIYGEKDGVHIFDLAKTREALLEALEEITKAAKESKVILLVGTKKQASDKTKEIAEATGMPYVAERWLGGTITNFEQMAKSIKRLEEMKKKTADGEYKDLTKMERLMKAREITKMERKFGGIAKLTKAPDMLVVIDIKKDKGAVREARVAGIPVVGIADTNADPRSVDFPVPMNDDATKALEFFLELVGKAVKMGKGKK